jgi:predicted RecB family nuclease
VTRRLRATDALVHLGGTRCDRRVWIKANDAADPKEPGDLQVALAELGEEHERRHAEEAFPDRLDLGEVEPLDEQVRRTVDAIAAGDLVIYQGALRATATLGGSTVEVVGLPDFIIPVDGGHVIQDAKLARSVDEKGKPGIVRQLQIYGWLFEQVTGNSPVGLEVFSGEGEVVPVPIDHDAARAELAEIERLGSLGDQPFEVVGWSKCQNCDYTEHCWDPAVEDDQPGTIPEVDVGLGRALHDLGITTYMEIPDRFDEDSLAELVRPWGKKTQRVGPSRAGAVMRNIESHLRDAPIVFAKPEVPEHDHYVMFDLEGVPPDLDGPEMVYLWGMQAYPADDSPADQPLFPLAGFGSGGDEQGWIDFLAGAAGLMERYGEDVPFVHWASYEKTKIKNYAETYGDPDGVAGQILETNLLDLLKITTASVALPLPSYSLKVIEKYVGYKRKLAGYKGDKSIARYMEAVETNDESHREQIVEELKKYNGEDLEATWVVQQWLQGLRP